jgi:Trk K+ transport system NAD-binding subunit
MFDQNMADKVRQGFQLETAMSQSALAAPAFVTAALEKSIVDSLLVNDELLVMERRPVAPGDPLCGQTVGDVMTAHGVGIVEHRSAGGIARLMPPPATRLSRGDEVILQGSYAALRALREKAAQPAGAQG